MNCREFDEQITPAVDNNLQNSAKHLFLDHAARCPGCRRAYEAERFIKKFVHQRLRMIVTPDAVRASVSRRLAREDQGMPAAGRLRSRRRPLLTLSFAVAAVLIIVFLLLQPAQNPADLSTPDRADVVTASLTHLAALTSGTTAPQLTSREPDIIERFFEGKTAFPVHVHTLHDIDPSGAVLNEAAGIPFAYVLYAGDGGTIYVYQTCWRTVQAGRVLHLKPQIKQALLEGRSYVEEDSEGRTMVFWTEGRTLCGAVARMEKQELLSHLALAQQTPLPAP